MGRPSSPVFYFALNGQWTANRNVEAVTCYRLPITLINSLQVPKSFCRAAR